MGETKPMVAPWKIASLTIVGFVILSTSATRALCASPDTIAAQGSKLPSASKPSPPAAFHADLQMLLAPISSRFASAEGKETPSFRRHVVPLLGKLGCNGRACHGSFQGRGGFRLSLFGYDFKMDHAALMAKS